MTTVIAIMVVALQTAACLGFGMSVLRGLSLAPELRLDERLTWSFAIGFGVLGWLVFFLGAAGAFAPAPLSILLMTGFAAAILISRDTKALKARLRAWSPAPLEKALIALLVVVLGLDFIEGLAPPTDADSLAYHFALPKLYLNAGELVFVPRAIDGAIPQLVQMTYVPVLGLGGERALTLWTMVSGWGVAALLFSLSRRHMDVPWALALTLVFLSTPAVIYGAGSGQVEVRLALFAAIAAYSVALARRTGNVHYALLAGLAAGFFMAGKYTGLLFAAAAGMVLLAQSQWFRHGAAMAGAGAVAGLQWYIWNWAHTGDPVFPMLFNALESWVDYSYWGAEHARYIQEAYFDLEVPAPVNPLWFAWYPFQATFAGLPEFDSGRVGLGPWGVLMLPFAGLGLWACREGLRGRALFPVAAVVGLFYAIWFFSGSSQKVRHLVTVYPLFLICLTAAALKWSPGGPALKALAGVFVITLGVQALGLAVYSAGPGRHVLSMETRDAYLQRSVSFYDTVPWINANLTAEDRLYTEFRQNLYFLDPPHFFAIPLGQALVDLRPGHIEPKRFVRQLRGQGITHLLVAGEKDSLAPHYSRLVMDGCARPVKRFDVAKVGSRSVSGLGAGRASLTLLQMQTDACPHG